MRIRRFQMKDMDQTVALYQKCFAEAPWFEVHDPEEVRKMLEEHSDEDKSETEVVYVCEHKGLIVGGAIGYHVGNKKDVEAVLLDARMTDNPAYDRKILMYGIYPVFYFAELFVDPSVRGIGIGKALIKKRRAFARKQQFKKGVVRTSLDQKAIQHLYIDTFGFKVVARQALLAKKLINGVEEELAYTSVIMVGKI